MATPMPMESDAVGQGSDLPPAFDAAYYLGANPDLDLSPEDAAEHYARVGRAEGRVASPLALRENLIALIADGRSVLEIGPFCDPLLRGPHIAYLDVLDADQLRARAMQIGLDPANCPERIDYVGGLDRVRRRFDAMISSHAIEHQPDLVEHLRQAERIIAPDGMFCLIIPDKRYCFDHHIPESSIAQVIQAHREQRRLHSLASVIEHVALTTHNDSRRHWAGDHGPAIPPDCAARVERAIRDHDLGGGRYIDVHAWYFTPDSFRTIIETLGALGLTGFELAGVYDAVRDRNEFCAVLRLSAAARGRALARDDEQGVILLQTSDADRYAPMLAVTATNVREYARRQGFGYDSFVGIKRGVHPWQATFNRIPMLADLLARGFTGWAVYLDADAYVQDLDFDLAAYLADKQDRAAIFATSGVTGEAWDVNAGVALINFGHPQGRALVECWAARFAAHSDAFLRDAIEWIDVGNDQDILHHILREEPEIAAAVLVEQMAFINGPHASFIRQHLRTMAPTLQDRLDALSAAVSEIMRGAGQPVPAQADDGNRRSAARFAHAAGRLPALVEAPLAAPNRDQAEAICAAWAASPKGAAIPGYQADFAAALDRGDIDMVAAELAGLGRSKAAQGFLGGARQHERARDRSFADGLARWTYDKLVSLAEAVGVLPLENPEGGRWGVNMLVDPAELFTGIEDALGIDLAPPDGIGGYLGVAVGRGIILHMRMIDAIHAAWRLRQIAAASGGSRIAELSGGAGFTAFYARRLGLEVRLLDEPIMRAIQCHLLGDRPDAEAMKTPLDALAASPPGSIDIMFNADSLPAIERSTAVALLREAGRIGIGQILSINQEAGLPGETAVADLVAAAGGWRLAARHRHWLRVGYVEEHYVASVPGHVF